MESRYLKRVLRHYDDLPFHSHPLWLGVQSGTFTTKQILLAEKQHYLRTKAGQILRKNSAEFAPQASPRIFEAALSNYLEEVAPVDGSENHLDMIVNLLIEGGVSRRELKVAKPTPGNSAAIALYRDIAARGTACHLIGAGSVEFYYSELSPKIFEAYTSLYGMSKFQAKTYDVHGPVDKVHAKRSFDVLDEAISIHGWTKIDESVRDAFVATSLHYDGMLQAISKNTVYWDGRIK
jgi:pyrroloquinoline quinone (PQQ) biosynthesis protein C